jgi:hypothetical protein
MLILIDAVLTVIASACLIGLCALGLVWLPTDAQIGQICRWLRGDQDRD